jgi:hypothetical protein
MPKGKKLTDELVKEILLQYYPHKVVFNITKMSKTNDAVYRYLMRETKKKQITMAKYLEHLGFVFVQKRNYQSIVDRLLELYPNRTINDSITKHRLYRIIAINAFNNGITPKEYLKQLGFIINKNIV